MLIIEERAAVSMGEVQGEELKEEVVGQGVHGHWLVRVHVPQTVY